MSMTESLAKVVGIKPSCDALMVSRAGFYRWKNQGADLEKEHIRPLSPLSLSPYEQQQVLDTLLMNGLSTKRHRRFTPPFWMAAVISVPLGRCTAFWKNA
jgi:hypothetical protein